MAAAQMTVRSVRPEDLEMPPSGFADFITPVELFFVRTHVAVPRVEIADWRLKVEGHVSTPLTLSMNGESLPVKHGFPLRAVVPGWAGSSWVKWVTSVRVLNEPFGGFWMKNAYLHPGKPVAPGTVVPPEAMTPVTSLRVKSVIAGVEVVGTRSVVRGAAWSGEAAPVAAVDVSVDQGRSWKPARLGGDATRYGWRLWEFSWTPSGDRHTTVLARARDAGGDVQPLVPEWNPSGYLWNAVVAPPGAPAPDAAATLAAPAGFRETCLTCHDADVIRQQRLT